MRAQVERLPVLDVHRLATGIRRLAVSEAALPWVASLFIGACAALAGGSLSWGWLGASALAILFLDAARRAVGELNGFDSSADAAAAAPLLTRRETAWAAGAFAALGGATGLSIAYWREPGVLWLGLVAASLAYFQYARPLQLSARGLGELATAVVYGPLLAAGVYLVQRHAVSHQVVLGALPLGLLAAAFVWLGELPTCPADTAAHRRTLVVRLGAARAVKFFPGVVLVPFWLLMLLPVARVPLGVWFGMAGYPFGLAAVAWLVAHPEQTTRIAPARHDTLVCILVAAAGIGIGLALWGR